MHARTLNKYKRALASGGYVYPPSESIILVKALWVLQISKDDLNKPQLTAKEISEVILSILEEKVKPTSIILSFNKSSRYIKTSNINGVTVYEILKPGRDYVKKAINPTDLKSTSGSGGNEVHFFEAGKKFTSKSMLRENILPTIKGPSFIVDPYLGVRTLDIIKTLKGPICLLTCLQNLKPRDAAEITREIKEFATERTDSEFRDLPTRTLHDRYLISEGCLLILGASLKDLGGKDAFIIKLSSPEFQLIIETMQARFRVLWDAGIDVTR